ncbi:MAG: hypothetical protein C5B51_14105 [Terriglobia bacterium]|nr:MAG: hypothetical protein C5B51_14105 [Terriglobia bacterium]
MELTSPDVIAHLLAEHQAPRRNRVMTTPMRPASTTSRRRCDCGVCALCVENARWDRIFKEKFADPNYYKGLPMKFSSPLR